jgi:lipoate-protein ligase A
VRYFDLTLPTLEANLALDELLLDAAEDRGLEHEALRFWEHPAHAVVLGAACRVGEDVLLDACRRDRIPLVRRTTGGGTVLIGPGCLNVALVLCYDRCATLRTIQGAFDYVMQRVVSVVRDLTGKAAVHSAGLADVCFGERKLGGSAQRRRRNALLYHGSLLYAFDLDRMSRYLAEPLRQPDYRRQRRHEDFLVNVPVDPAMLKERLAQEWNATEMQQDWPVEEVARLAAEKFSDLAWTFRR